MITTMTTVGYGDIICISFIERIYHIFLLVIGTLLYTFIISKIGNYLRDQSHEQIKLSRDLNILESIRISYPKMPYKLYSKIQSHLVSTSKKRKTSGISILINGVPEAIKKDLLFKIYSKVIKGFAIFKQANNSNFVHQMLTSFIPILSRKEEIILMEGEFVENISFVKDGLLSLEISIDLKDPYKSIRNYIETNFVGISRKEEMKNCDISHYKRRNSVFSIVVNDNYNNNYDDLKVKLDNMLSDKKNSLNNISKNDNNGISYDLGRMNFSREDIELNNESVQMIKIMDIRKNEYFGDIHLFLEQRSPFTIKTKTRIAEILFLRKKDALHISRNFPNVSRRIQNRSYHNLVSIKNKTFKILRQYYDTYLFNEKRKSIRLNLNVTKNSGITRDNFSKFFTEKSQDKSNFNSFIPNNSFKKKNNLFSVHTKKSENIKINDNSLTRELNFNNESFNSNSIYNSQFQFPNVTIKKTKKESKEDIIKYQKYQSLNTSNVDKWSKKKGPEINLLKNEIIKIKHTFSNPKKILSLEKIKTKDSKYKLSLSNKKNNNFYNSRKEDRVFPKIKRKSKIVHFKLDEEENDDQEKDDDEDEEEENFQFEKASTEKMNINNSIKELLTFKNNNGNLSKIIKIQLEKRKKIQKILQYLNLQKYKINKNLIELYFRQNSIERKSSNKILIINQHNKINSNTSSQNKILSEILNSSNGEINSSVINKNIEIFNNKELKIIKAESFEIKSSYKSINFISKGKMINDAKYKLYAEKFFEDINKMINLKIIEDEKKVFNNNNNQYYSEVELPFVSQNKNNFEGMNNLLKKNAYDNLKTPENLNSISELKSSIKMNNLSKLLDKENLEKLTLNNIGLYKKEENINIKNGNNVENNIKIYSIGKILFKSKKTKKENGKNNNMENFLNKLDELNKDNNSKNENISLFEDKNQNASGIKLINLKSTDKEKEGFCIIY